jgi:hypothetical protein
MVEKRVLPEFKSEAEEAEWWSAHQDEILDDFLAAEAEGRLEQKAALVYTVPLSNVVHLESRSIAVAREQAAKRGVDYEVYLQHLVDDGLMREAKAS